MGVHAIDTWLNYRRAEGGVHAIDTWLNYRRAEVGVYAIVTWLNYRRAEGGGSCYRYMVKLQKGRGWGFML